MSIPVEGVVTLIEVFDINASMAFYCDLLGFEVVATSDPERELGWVWLRRNDAELMLNTMYEPDERPERPDPRRSEAHGDTVFFFGCRDVDAAYRYLVSRGIDVKPPSVTGYGMLRLSLADPDGYGLCFQWRAA